MAPVMPPGRTAPGAGVGVGDGVGSMDQMNAAAMRPTSRVAMASANPLIRAAMMARIRTTATSRTISQFHHGGNTAGAGDGAGDGASTSLVTWSMDTIPSGGVTGGTKESSPELTRVNRAGRVVSEVPSRRLGRVNRRNVAENILSDHIRSLIGTHLLDVPSSNQHTVKPWFNGKLDFSPDVKDFASQGFPLIGGRLDYLMDRPVAALIYGRRQHVINVFTWPADSPLMAESHHSRNGDNAIHWSHGSMTFWAVSDIAPTELGQFKNLYEK